MIAMKNIFLLSLILAVLTSCGSQSYFIKQADDNDPHAVLVLKDGATQVVKIDGKYPPEDAPASVRLEPGLHTIDVTHQATQVGFLNSILGTAGREVTTHSTMTVDLAPGKRYRPSCNSYGSSGASFFLIDQSGVRSNFTQSAVQNF